MEERCRLLVDMLLAQNVKRIYRYLTTSMIFLVLIVEKLLRIKLEVKVNGHGCRTVGNW